MEAAGKSKTADDPFINKVFFNKYIITKKLGEGSFGMIYLATFEDEKYALKFENKKKGQSLLESEAYIMSYLKGPGIPFVKSYGYSGDYNILVMELLGKSLEDIFSSFPGKKFSVKTACMLGYQMVNILQYIHSKHIIHRDIKPDNFVIGLDTNSKFIYLLDFGLAKKYRSSTTLLHYPMTNKKKLTGTARYASINALKGLEQSRRDDLEAVGYVLMYFLRGSLPWQGLPVKNKDDRYQKIMEKKRSTTPEALCEGFPGELEKYIDYARNLGYEEDPDYDYLKGLFITILNSNEEELDYVYDWVNSRNHAVESNEENKINKSPGKIQVDANNNIPLPSSAQIMVVNNYLNQVNNIVITSPNKNEEAPGTLKVHGNNLNTHSSILNTVHAQREETLGYMNLKTLHGVNQSSNIVQYKPTNTENNRNTRGELVTTKKSIKDNRCCVM